MALRRGKRFRAVSQTQGNYMEVHIVRRGLVYVMALLVLVGTGCSSDGHDHAADHMDGTVPGAPADAAAASREVVVEAQDALRFDPQAIELNAGEVVTFVIRNVGSTDHEFVLGDESYQEMHHADMEEGAEMMHMDNAVALQPGQTKRLTWQFDEQGEVLYGCHEPGHYEGGMVGRIEIS